MLTQELSASVERTIISLAVFVLAGLLLLRFDANTAVVALCGPWVGAVIAAWFIQSNSGGRGDGGKP